MLVPHVAVKTLAPGFPQTVSMTDFFSLSLPFSWSTSQTMRTTAMLLNIFGPYDVIRTKTKWMTNIYGQFAVTLSVCSTSYLIIWPLETLKNMGQVT